MARSLLPASLAMSTARFSWLSIGMSVLAPDGRRGTIVGQVRRPGKRMRMLVQFEDGGGTGTPPELAMVEMDALRRFRRLGGS